MQTHATLGNTLPPEGAFFEVGVQALACASLSAGLKPWRIPHQAVPRRSKDLSGLGSREKNLAEPKVAQRPSERARASQFKLFQAICRKKRLFIFFADIGLKTGRGLGLDHISGSA
jgi:hypothetical protein